MKKYIIIAIFLFILAGCTPREETEQSTTDTMNTATQTITESFASTPTAIPTTETTETPAASDTPTPEPTATPLPTPIPEFDLPDGYFDNGGLSEFGYSYKVTCDEEGNIYYVDNDTIIKIDAVTDETVSILTSNEVSGGNIYGVRYIDGRLYAQVDTGDLEKPFELFDIETGKMLIKGLSYNCYFFENIIMNMNDENKLEYDFIDLKTGNSVMIQNLSTTFDGQNVSAVYFSDEYIIFLNKYPISNDLNNDNRFVYFVNADTYAIEGVINTTDIADGYFDIVYCKSNDIYILRYDEAIEKQVLSKYNVQSKRLTNIIEFSNGRRVFGFDADEKNLYFTYSLGYKHSQENTNGDSHEEPEWCLEEADVETATEKFMMINIETKQIETIAEVSTWEYIKDDYCINLMHPIKIGEYIFALSEDFFESTDPYKISSRFRIGEEIDYSTWKN